MEKLSEEQEKVLRKALDQVGLEEPSPNFLSNVMDAIEVQAKSTSPLIGKKGWMLLAFVFIVSLGVLVFYPEEGSTVFDTIFSYRLEFAQNLFQELKIPKTMVMGMALLGLFLFQVPFLIKMTSRERSF